MRETQLSWPQRGKLWLRLGIRLVLTVVLVWLVWKVGLPLLSLLAPFVAALITAALLHPPVRWLQRKLGWSRKLLSLFILVLLFGLLGAALGYLGYAGVSQLASLVQNWDGLLASLQNAMDQIEALFSQLWALVPPTLNDTVSATMDSLLEWLQTSLPGMLEGSVTWLKDKAMGLPSFGLALIIYIMASYLLTADYPYLRSQAARHTHQRLLNFLTQVRDVAVAAFGGYLKAEFLLSVGVFFILMAGFFLIGQPYGLLLALGAAVLLHLLYLALNGLMNRSGHGLAPEEQASVIYNNAGNLILPMVMAILGQEYVIYTSVYILVQNILMWTHGQKLMGGAQQFDWKKIVTTPAIAAILAGLALFITGLRLPGPLVTAMEGLGSCMAPLSMLVIGILFSELDLKRVLCQGRIYWVAGLRLLVYPLLSMVVLLALRVLWPHSDGDNVLLVSLLCAIGPAASAITQMAQLYHNPNSGYVSSINVLTTLLCAVTMPVMVLLFQLGLDLL